MVWLPKEEVDPLLIAHLRSELTVTPRKARGYDDVKSDPIRCYVETPFEFGVPRAFWFGSAKKSYDYDWDVSFGSGWESQPECLLRHEGPYAEQGEIIDLFRDRFEKCGPGCAEDEEPSDRRAGLLMGGIFQADTGFGKCLGIGTPVLMNDGEVKPVEDILAGECVMGPDSRPRRVTGTTRGEGRLFKIVPTKGDTWVCNDVHVLTLVNTRTNVVVDIPLNEYLERGSRFKHEHKLFQPDHIDFKAQGRLPVDPYFIGLWIGDGTKDLRGVRVTTEDAEVVEYLREVAVDWGCDVTPYDYPGRCPTYGLVTDKGQSNPLLTVMQKLFRGGLAIPKLYLFASREERLRLLAGLLDSDGSLATKGSTFEFAQKDRSVADGVAFLARSLGFRVTVREKFVGGSRYDRLLISGDTSVIPVRVERKKAAQRRQKKNHLRTGFKVEELGVGEYAGFTLDGDGRFLLGDFTVTHNTDTALGLINKLQTTTLVIVHKEFLQNQWMNRARKWFPDMKVGLVREKKCDFEGKHLVIAMAQSLALDEGERYPAELYDWPGLLVVDECHRAGAPTWASIPPKFNSAWRLGMTATPRRWDGADKVFWWHIGEIVYRARTETPKPNVRMIKVVSNSLPPVMKRDNVKAPIVINILVKLKRRNRKAVEEMIKALKAPSGRKLFVLSERLDHLRKLEALLQEKWKEERDEDLSTGFYVGEWFTGEVVPKLAPRSWPMKDGGREKAIDTIYRSMSRSWKPVEELGELKPAISVDKSTGEKHHNVFMQWGDVSAIKGIVTDGDEDDEWVHVVLEELEDAHLYDIARLFDIQQKKVERKRRQTEDELHEAERARVIFATYQMCAEGVDIPAIDTEILVSPVSDVEQANGRIRRICLPEPEKCDHFCPWRAANCQGKPQPIVSDIVDLGIPLASKRERYRRDYYDILGTVVAG
jgi:superfamily II DNA or RNA helicase